MIMRRIAKMQSVTCYNASGPPPILSSSGSGACWNGRRDVLIRDSISAVAFGKESSGVTAGAHTSTRPTHASMATVHQEAEGMARELPPGYQPSSTEEFMNPLQVAYFRQRLETSRADLQRELAAIPPPTVDEGNQEGDQTDQASAGSEREFGMLNRERVQTLLRQTERALAKLEAGTYGYCDVTGEPIDLRRLLAQPATCLSLEAQQAREGRPRR
jgi:DnaK suppressor protein